MNIPKLVYLVSDVTVANKFGLDQISYLKHAGIDVLLVCGPGVLDQKLSDNCMSVNQVEFLQRNISLINDLKCILYLTKLFRSMRPTGIMYATPKASLIGAIVGYITGIETRIYQILGARWQTLTGIHGVMIKLFDRFTVSLSTDLIGVSNSIASLYMTNFQKSVVVLGKGSAIGVDRTVFNTSHLANKVINSNILIGYAGRIAKDKGIDELITILDHIRISYPNAKLEIIGDFDESDPISSRTENLLKNGQYIHIYSHMDREQLSLKMSSWNLHVFPSFREGLGNAIIEASALGIPTIAWDIIGVCDAIPEYLHGFLIPSGHLELFKSKVIDYLSNQFDKNQSIILSQWVIKNYDKEVVLSLFSKHIKQLLVVERKHEL